MKNALSYEQYNHITRKVDAFLRSLGIDPDAADGKNDPRADLLLALVAEMMPAEQKPGWVGISNCLWGVVMSKQTSDMHRLMGVAATHHLFTTDPIASAEAQGNAHRVEDCRRALYIAASNLMLGASSASYASMMEQVFGDLRRVHRDNPSILCEHEELRLQKLDGSEGRLVYFSFGDYIASANCKTAEEARAILLTWKGEGVCKDHINAFFLANLAKLFP